MGHTALLWARAGVRSACRGTCVKPGSGGRVHLDQPLPGGRLGRAARGRFRERGEPCSWHPRAMDVGRSGPWTAGGTQRQNASPSAVAGRVASQEGRAEEEWLDLRRRMPLRSSRGHAHPAGQLLLENVSTEEKHALSLREPAKRLSLSGCRQQRGGHSPGGLLPGSLSERRSQRQRA